MVGWELESGHFNIDLVEKTLYLVLSKYVYNLNITIV